MHTSSGQVPLIYKYNHDLQVHADACERFLWCGCLLECASASKLEFEMNPFTTSQDKYMINPNCNTDGHIRGHENACMLLWKR